MLEILARLAVSPVTDNKISRALLLLRAPPLRYIWRDRARPAKVLLLMSDNYRLLARFTFFYRFAARQPGPRIISRAPMCSTDRSIDQFRGRPN